jgi:hypothetical protein
VEEEMVNNMSELREQPRCKQRGIDRNIYNRPKGRGIKSLSASGGLNRIKPLGLVSIIVVFFLSGCTVLTKSQTKEVQKFAHSADSYAHLPGDVIQKYAEIRKAGKFLAAHTLSDADASARIIEDALRIERQLNKRADRADRAIKIVSDYSKILIALTAAYKRAPPPRSLHMIETYANDLDAAEKLTRLAQKSTKAAQTLQRAHQNMVENLEEKADLKFAVEHIETLKKEVEAAQKLVKKLK